MVWRRVACLAVAFAAISILLVSATACTTERDMPDSVEMTDTMEVIRALEDPDERDALLDTMPGGEMVRGDSAAEMNLLKEKM